MKALGKARTPFYGVLVISGIFFSFLGMGSCRTTSVSSNHPQTMLMDSEDAGGEAFGFQYLGRSIQEMHELLIKEEVKVEDLTRFYIKRIKRLNRRGPELKALISINPDVLDIAKKLDALPAVEKARSHLFWGIPIIVNDNIEAAGSLPTTAGSLALRLHVTDRDAKVVEHVRAKGAIILGKGNLSEWGGLRGILGWSAVGGQLFSPFPQGTSFRPTGSGAAVAVAAGLAMAGIGTETLNAVTTQGFAENVTMIKPPHGYLSREGLIPISYDLDTPVAIAGSLEDSLALLNAMTDDQTSSSEYPNPPRDASLRGQRIGYIVSGKKGEKPGRRKIWQDALKTIGEAGAQLVAISDTKSAHIDCESEKVITSAVKSQFEPFLKNLPAKFKVHSLEELNEFHANTKGELVDSFSVDYLREAEDIETASSVYREHFKRCKSVAADFFKVAAVRQVDVLVDLVPSQMSTWAEFSGAMYVTLPAGFDSEGIPVSLGIYAAKGKENLLLHMASAFERTQQNFRLNFSKIVLPE